MSADFVLGEEAGDAEKKEAKEKRKREKVFSVSWFRIVVSDVRDVVCVSLEGHEKARKTCTQTQTCCCQGRLLVA